MVKPEKRIKRSHWHLGHVPIMVPAYPPVNIIVDGLQTLEPLALVKIFSFRRHAAVRCKVNVVQCIREHAMDVLRDAMLRSRDVWVKPAHFTCEAVVDLQTSDLTLAPLFRPISLPGLYIARILLVRDLKFGLVLIVWIIWTSA